MYLIKSLWWRNKLVKESFHFVIIHIVFCRCIFFCSYVNFHIQKYICVYICLFEREREREREWREGDRVGKRICAYMLTCDRKHENICVCECVWMSAFVWKHVHVTCWCGCMVESMHAWMCVNLYVSVCEHAHVCGCMCVVWVCVRVQRKQGDICVRGWELKMKPEKIKQKEKKYFLPFSFVLYELNHGKRSFHILAKLDMAYHHFFQAMKGPRATQGRSLSTEDVSLKRELPR